MAVAVHPGRILGREIEARSLSIREFAGAVGTTPAKISAVVGCKRGINAGLAIRLGRYFGNAPMFWMNLQSLYELALAEKQGEKRAA